jgi:hypothetical protein
VAEDLYRRPAAALQSQLIPVAPAREIVIRDTGESGWSAVAMKHDAEESVKFLVIKGSERRFLDVTELIFVNQTPPLAPAGGNGTAAWRFRLLS